ncbi:MAG: RNA methyltransferase [Proteobacteria bacterium]|nr:RNA methyltransferase [Pseudomonadota bacterium]
MKKREIGIVVADLKYPMNIGSVVRTMSCSGYKELTLVRPCESWNSMDAVKFSLFGRDILESAKIVKNLEDIKDKGTVLFGFSRRIGKKRSYPIMLSGLYDFISRFHVDKKIKFVFGGESSGLTTEDLNICDHIVTVDPDIIDNSLSLPTAVAVVLYEYKRAYVLSAKKQVKTAKKLDMGQAGILNENVRELLNKMEFIDNRDSKRVMAKIKDMINKLSTNEIRLLHSILKRVKL